MSKLEVDQVDPQSSTNLTLGTSGDTIIIPSGVTLNAGASTLTLPDDSVTLAKMASGTDGNIISYDASGNPVAVATGTDGQVLTSAGAGAPPAFETPASGKVLQVVQGTSTTAFNTTSTTYANSSLSGVITPSSTSSKILVMASQIVQTYNASGAYGTGGWKIIKTIGATTTDVTVVNSTSNGNLLVYDYGTSGISVTRPASLIKLDTPNTTSEITYRTQAAMGSNGGSNVALIDNLTTGTIILMEIAG